MFSGDMTNTINLGDERLRWDDQEWWTSGLYVVNERNRWTNYTQQQDWFPTAGKRILCN